MSAPVHHSDGMSAWGSCSLPVANYPHARDGSQVTCKRPGCRVHVPKVEQPRRIALVIAPATKTHCGPGLDIEGGIRCPMLKAGEEEWECKAFDRSFEYNADRTYPKRLPECLAAEVK